jgi:hypothetical protein
MCIQDHWVHVANVNKNELRSLRVLHRCQYFSFSTATFSHVVTVKPCYTLRRRPQMEIRLDTLDLNCVYTSRYARVRIQGSANELLALPIQWLMTRRIRNVESIINMWINPCLRTSYAPTLLGVFFLRKPKNYDTLRRISSYMGLRSACTVFFWPVTRFVFFFYNNILHTFRCPRVLIRNHRYGLRRKVVGYIKLS